MKYIVDSDKMKNRQIYYGGHKSSSPCSYGKGSHGACQPYKAEDKEDRILVVCGPGNNGADGVAAGRILFLQGYQVAILLPLIQMVV